MDEYKVIPVYDPPSGFSGWAAEIWIDGRLKDLEVFRTPKEAEGWLAERRPHETKHW